MPEAEVQYGIFKAYKIVRFTMIDRVIHYYQAPTAPGFATHMITETGLSEEQQKLVWDLRKSTGDTQFYADKAQMPIKRYNATVAAISQRMVAELLRLAQIGLEAEKNREN